MQPTSTESAPNSPQKADVGAYLVWRQDSLTTKLKEMLIRERRNREESLGQMDFCAEGALDKAKGFRHEIMILRSLQNFLEKDTEEVREAENVEFTL